jgi:hypothetical protein
MLFDSGLLGLPVWVYTNDLFLIRGGRSTKLHKRGTSTNQYLPKTGVMMALCGSKYSKVEQHSYALNKLNVYKLFIGGLTHVCGHTGV